MELCNSLSLRDTDGGCRACTDTYAAGSADGLSRGVRTHERRATKRQAGCGPGALAEPAANGDAQGSHSLKNVPQNGGLSHSGTHGTPSPDRGVWTVASRAVTSRFRPANDAQSRHVDWELDVRLGNGRLEEIHTHTKVIRAPLATV